MIAEYAGIFDALTVPAADQESAALFSVKPVSGFRSYFVGKDTRGKACLLVSTTVGSGRTPPPIRLESLDAQFELACRITDVNGHTTDSRFTVARCRSDDPETIHYFFSVCDIIIRHLGDSPSHSALASAVKRLASIFQSIRIPPIRSLNGLFGELFVISRSRNPLRTVAAWRIDNAARFDFSVGDIRLDAKTSTSRLRRHRFSYDQCNPPPDTKAVVCSLIAERVPGGVSLADMIAGIEAQIATDEDLLLKLHEVVAATLGTSLVESLAVTFDERLAESSLLFFDLRAIPAVRHVLAPGVSDVRFSSDLSGQSPLCVDTLIDLDPLFWDLLPDDLDSDGKS